MMFPPEQLTAQLTEDLKNLSTGVANLTDEERVLLLEADRKSYQLIAAELPPELAGDIIAEVDKLIQVLASFQLPLPVVDIIQNVFKLTMEATKYRSVENTETLAKVVRMVVGKDTNGGQEPSKIILLS